MCYPTVGVASFGSDVSERLSSAREEFSVTFNLIIYQGLSWAVCLGRAGPGRSENCDGPGRAGPRLLKMRWAGPGRAETFEKLMGRVGPGRAVKN